MRWIDFRIEVVFIVLDATRALVGYLKSLDGWLTGVLAGLVAERGRASK